MRTLYAGVAASGTRSDGYANVVLSSLKSVIGSELKRKAMGDFVPGVNILIGLAEDSLAAWKSIEMVGSGAAEMSTLANSLDTKIAAARKELERLGRDPANTVTEAQRAARTA